MTTYTPFLSKSKNLSGLQCHKVLWFYYNAKDQIPPTSEKRLRRTSARAVARPGVYPIGYKFKNSAH